MSNFKGTPGPWETNCYGDLIGSDGQRVVFGGDGFSIGSGRDEVWIANGILAKAAPDLLEALQALRLAREQDKYPSWEKGVPEFAKAEALADAALAKALGA
jgi:hypothetical protein